MLYNLARPFADQFILFNLFRYITFRSGAACLTALVVSFVVGPVVDPLAQARAAQRPADPSRRAGAAPDREEGHADDGRRADPVRARPSRRCCGPICATATSGRCCSLTLGYGALGFVDDYLKLSKANLRGLSGRGKLIVQAVARPGRGGLDHGADARAAGDGAHHPGVQGGADPARLCFPLFGMLVMLGSSNAVNLTDGLDGLAIVPTIICAGVFALIAYLVGNRIFADYLQLTHGPRRRRTGGVLLRADRRGPRVPLVQRAARRRCSWATPAASPSAARSARSRSRRSTRSCC